MAENSKELREEIEKLEKRLEYLKTLLAGEVALPKGFVIGEVCDSDGSNLKHGDTIPSYPNIFVVVPEELGKEVKVWADSSPDFFLTPRGGNFSSGKGWVIPGWDNLICAIPEEAVLAFFRNQERCHWEERD